VSLRRATHTHLGSHSRRQLARPQLEFEAASVFSFSFFGATKGEGGRKTLQGKFEETFHVYGPSTNKQQKKPGGGDDDDLVLIQFLNPLAVLRPWGEMLHA
jgi:hypothetical protein